MQQVIFRLPIPGFANGLPIYGFGLMVVVAIFLNLWLARRRAAKEGVSGEKIYDLAIWIIVGGFIGARVVYMIQYKQDLWDFYKVWEGGLVWYGAAVGGWIGYGLGYLIVFRKSGINTWQIADFAAPAAALGLAIGRIGCLLNGCCYGDVVSPDVPAAMAIPFPARSLPWTEYTKRGYQTAAGFTIDRYDDMGATVLVVDPESPAAKVGQLQPGDRIVKIDDMDVRGKIDPKTNVPISKSYEEIVRALFPDPAKDKSQKIKLTVERKGIERELPAFPAWSVPIFPTQIFETISMALLFWLLYAFYPFRMHYGQVMTVFLMCYAVHRFLNELLRNDTAPVAFGLTLSQNGSILIFLAALALEIYLWRTQPRLTPALATAAPSPPAPATVSKRA